MRFVEHQRRQPLDVERSGTCGQVPVVVGEWLRGVFGQPGQAALGVAEEVHPRDELDAHLSGTLAHDLGRIAHLRIEKRLTQREISVIYNAADKATGIAERDNSGSRVLVYMGSFIGYKNVGTIEHIANMTEEALYEVHHAIEVCICLI